MSLARAALHARPRLANSTLLLQCRLASSAASHEECHGVHHDPDGTQYPNEGAYWFLFSNQSHNEYFGVYVHCRRILYTLLAKYRYPLDARRKLLQIRPSARRRNIPDAIPETIQALARSVGEFKREALIQCHHRGRRTGVTGECTETDDISIQVPTVSLHFVGGNLLRTGTFHRKFDFVSPHLSPVGSEIDMSSVVAKGSHE